MRPGERAPPVPVDPMRWDARDNSLPCPVGRFRCASNSALRSEGSVSPEDQNTAGLVGMAPDLANCANS